MDYDTHHQTLIPVTFILVITIAKAAAVAPTANAANRNIIPTNILSCL